MFAFCGGWRPTPRIKGSYFRYFQAVVLLCRRSSASLFSFENRRTGVRRSALIKNPFSF